MLSTVYHKTEVRIMIEGKDTGVYVVDEWLPVYTGEVILIFDKSYMVVGRVFSIDDIQIAEDTYERTGILYLNVKVLESVELDDKKSPC